MPEVFRDDLGPWTGSEPPRTLTPAGNAVPISLDDPFVSANDASVIRHPCARIPAFARRGSFNLGRRIRPAGLETVTAVASGPEGAVAQSPIGEDRRANSL